jgi:hypothetical protein
MLEDNLGGLYMYRKYVLLLLLLLFLLSAASYFCYLLLFLLQQSAAAPPPAICCSSCFLPKTLQILSKFCFVLLGGLLFRRDYPGQFSDMQHFVAENG